jgi:hypothetical protein
VNTLHDDRTNDASLRRANELDTLAGILPADRREALAALLTDEDVATLRHLAEEGMGANTLHALASDLGYLEAWALAATGFSLPWPAPEGLALKFLAHHLWDPVKRETDPGHGIPDAVMESLKVERFLRADGPHAPATVRRRLASWGRCIAGAILTRCLPHRPTRQRFGSPCGHVHGRLNVRASGQSPVRCSTGCLLLAC